MNKQVKKLNTNKIKKVEQLIIKPLTKPKTYYKESQIVLIA